MGSSGNVALFVLFYVIIISMYGGGFSTLPAYLADLFGTRYVGGIHGRLLTAWAAGGILGPVLEIGRASCRERVCQYVSLSVVAVSLKKKTNAEHIQHANQMQ